MKSKVAAAAKADLGYTAPIVALYAEGSSEEKLEIISVMREMDMGDLLIDDVLAETVPAEEHPKCRPGWHWDEELEACVPD